MNRTRATIALAMLVMLVATGCAVVPPQPAPGSACDGIAKGTVVKTDHGLWGNILLNDTVLSGVHITVEGGRFTAETCSGVDGKWTVYVPGPSTYFVTLDGATLPTGMTIDASGAGGVTVIGGDVRQEVEWGLTDMKAVHFFFEEVAIHVTAAITGFRRLARGV